MLTDEQEEKLYFIMRSYPDGDQTLLRAVYEARWRLRGMMKAKAFWIIACCFNGQPKIGWQDDAKEVIASLQ